VAAVEKPRIEVLLELLDLKCHSRLRHEQHFGCLGKRQLLGNRMENLKPAISHTNHLRIEEFLYDRYSITNHPP